MGDGGPEAGVRATRPQRVRGSRHRAGAGLEAGVRRGIGIPLARQGDEDTTIVLLVLRQLVRRIIRGSLDPGPLAPEIDAGSSFDHLRDISAAHTGSGFEEVDVTILARFNKFRVGDAAHHAERFEQFPVQFL